MDHPLPLPGKGDRHAPFDIAQTPLLFNQRKAAAGTGHEADAEVVDRLDIGFADRMGQRFAQGVGDGGTLSLGLQPEEIDDDEAAEVEGTDDTADFSAIWLWCAPVWPLVR